MIITPNKQKVKKDSAEFFLKNFFFL